MTNRLEVGVNNTLAGWANQTAENAASCYKRGDWTAMYQQQYPSGKVVFGITRKSDGFNLEVEVGVWQHMACEGRLPSISVHPDYVVKWANFLNNNEHYKTA